MLENIWRGLLIDYHYLLSHSLQVGFFLLLGFSVILFRVLSKIRMQQRRAYSELLEQQHLIEKVQYRIDRMDRICHENRDKQRFISNQLSTVDDSIYELEECVTTLKEIIRHPPVQNYFESVLDEKEDSHVA